MYFICACVDVTIQLELCLQPAKPKPVIFAPQLNLMLLPLPTDTLNGYPSPVYPMLDVNWYAFERNFAYHPKSQLKQC